MIAEKVSNTFCRGTLWRSATEAKGNVSWQVSATSTIKLGECFLPALALGIWNSPLRGVGDWSRGVGEFDGEGDGGPSTCGGTLVVDTGRFCGTVLGT